MLPIYYFAQYFLYYVYFIRYVLKPTLALSPRSLRNNDAICNLILGNVLKNSNKKMLVPHALDLADKYVIIISVFHICRHLISSLSSPVIHWSAELQTKIYDPRKEERKD